MEKSFTLNQQLDIGVLCYFFFTSGSHLPFSFFFFLFSYHCTLSILLFSFIMGFKGLQEDEQIKINLHNGYLFIINEKVISSLGKCLLP